MNDLKGLGPTDGPPVKYQWTPPSALPRLVPWLIIIGLLFLKPNRAPQAWLVLAPLGIAVLACHTLVELVMTSVGATQLISFFDPVFASLAFALASIWLLAPLLQTRLRFLTVLKMLLVAGAAGLIAFLLAQDWSQGPQLVASSILMGICVVLTVTSLGLAAWRCKGRFRPAGLLIWSLVFLAILPVLIFTPIMLGTVGRSGMAMPWGQYLGMLLGPAVACFAVLLMFLLLAMLSGYYRRRLQALLQLDASNVPPVLSTVNPVPPPAVLERMSS